METVGGYRLVRILGEGERAEVWLGHAGVDGVAAIKLFRGDIDGEQIDHEVRALSAVRSRHLLALTDVGADGDGRPCLILPRLSGPSVAQLLARRRSIEDGELVTLVAPIVEAVAALQTTGVAHRGISPRSVLLDDAGAPVLIGFGQALAPSPERRGPLPPARVSEHPELASDRELLYEYVTAVAAHTGVGQDISAWIAAHRGDDHVLEGLVGRLHAVGPGRAVSTDDAPVHVAFPVRHVPVIDSEELALESSAGSLGARGILARIVESGPRSAVLPGLRASLGTVRRPVWVAGATGLLALLVAIVAIPSMSNSSSATTVRSGDPGPQTTAAPSIRGPGAAPSASPMSATPTTAEGVDDLVEAIRHVLVQRMHCLNLNSPECLESVDQPGSAALVDDRAHVSDPGRAPAVPRALTLVEQLGDTAIVGLDEPAPDGGYRSSVLMVKTDAGWRLRDTITGVLP